jgi:hypothetical protein
VAKVPGQPDYRKVLTFRDQHGRQYDNVFEIKPKGGPVGAPSPKGWRPPHPALMPPMQYFRWDVPGQLDARIDYDAWITDLRSLHSEYTQQIWEIARARFGEKAAEAVNNPPPQLLYEAGPGPLKIELVMAMRQGNRWALGFTPEDKANIARFLPFEPVPYEPDLRDDLLDLEEEVDPEALGGKKQKIRAPRAERAVQEA